jgi:hypothetical protein
MRVAVLFAVALLPHVFVAQVRTSESEHLASILRLKGIEGLIDEACRPQRGKWTQIMKRLSQPDSLQYFLEIMKSAVMPESCGTLISQTGNELALAMLDRSTADVTLRLETPLPQPLEPGTRVLFTGVAREFVARPLMVLVDALPDVRFIPPQAESVTRTR